MKNHGMNQYLPSWEYVPDGEPHVFGKHGRSVATGQPTENPTGPAPNPCEAAGA